MLKVIYFALYLMLVAKHICYAKENREHMPGGPHVPHPEISLEEYRAILARREEIRRLRRLHEQRDREIAALRRRLAETERLRGVRE